MTNMDPFAPNSSGHGLPVISLPQEDNPRYDVMETVKVKSEPQEKVAMKTELVEVVKNTQNRTENQRIQYKFSAKGNINSQKSSVSKLGGEKGEREDAINTNSNTKKIPQANQISIKSKSTCDDSTSTSTASMLSNNKSCGCQRGSENQGICLNMNGQAAVEESIARETYDNNAYLAPNAASPEICEPEVVLYTEPISQDSDFDFKPIPLEKVKSEREEQTSTKNAIDSNAWSMNLSFTPEECYSKHTKDSQLNLESNPQREVIPSYEWQSEPYKRQVRTSSIDIKLQMAIETSVCHKNASLKSTHVLEKTKTHQNSTALMETISLDSDLDSDVEIVPAPDLQCKKANVESIGFESEKSTHFTRIASWGPQSKRRCSAKERLTVSACVKEELDESEIAASIEKISADLLESNSLDDAEAEFLRNEVINLKRQIGLMTDTETTETRKKERKKSRKHSRDLEQTPKKRRTTHSSSESHGRQRSKILSGSSKKSRKKSRNRSSSTEHRRRRHSNKKSRKRKRGRSVQSSSSSDNECVSRRRLTQRKRKVSRSSSSSSIGRKSKRRQIKRSSSSSSSIDLVGQRRCERRKTKTCSSDNKRHHLQPSISKKKADLVHIDETGPSTSAKVIQIPRVKIKTDLFSNEVKLENDDDDWDCLPVRMQPTSTSRTILFDDAAIESAPRTSNIQQNSAHSVSIGSQTQPATADFGTNTCEIAIYDNFEAQKLYWDFNENQVAALSDFLDLITIANMDDFQLHHRILNLCKLSRVPSPIHYVTDEV